MNRYEGLDGLRGYAAVVVLLSHCALTFWPGMQAASPASGPVSSFIFHSPLTFFLNGSLAVLVFFILSGYVLSVGFFATGRNEIVQNLLIKRYVRLAVPILASCLLCYAIWRMGGFTASQTDLPPFIKLFYRPEESLTLFGAVKEGLLDSLLLGYGQYNFVLWTMRIELIGSIIVFSNCLLLKGVPGRAFAYAAQIAVLLYTQEADAVPLLCFIVGLAMADPQIAKKGFHVPLWVTLPIGVAAILLGGYQPGSGSHEFLSALSLSVSRVQLGPAEICYTVSAALIVFLAVFSPAGQMLGGPVGRFLGRISFSLYLTHTLVLASVGVFAYAYLRSTLAYQSASLIAAAVTIASAIAVAALISPIDYGAQKLSAFLLRAVRGEGQKSPARSSGTARAA